MQQNDSENPTASEKRIGTQVKNDSPRVSIIIPAYNCSELIKETLDSALAQTFTDYEIILVNDGSADTEKLEEILKPYFEQIIYIKQKNRGAGAARNLAIKNARGEILAFLDSDDIWFPGFLKSQIELFEKKELDLIYADALWFGGSAMDGKTFMQTCPSEGIVSITSLLSQDCNVLTSATLVRKSVVLEAGMFEEKRVRAHDFVLWLKIAKKGFRLGYQKKVLLKHRVHIESLSGNSFDRVQREINVFRRVKKLIDFSDSQRQIIKKQIKRLEAEKELERGKSFLLQENFTSAINSFKKANKYQNSKKLQAIIYLLRFSPKLFLRIYRTRREKEIRFVPKTEVN